MTTTKGSRPFTTTADEGRLEATIVALEAPGFGVEVVEDSDAAGVTVLACSRGGASVMTNTSVTLGETGIAHRINESGNYECRPP